jgi:Holliday junction resolvase RusA-like endonuclease
MKILLEIELEGLPPTVNSMYRSKRNGQRYKRENCRAYQKQVTARMRECWQGAAPCTGRVELLIKYEVKDKRRWDIDNRLKALQDCLTSAGILKDDSQIDSLKIKRVPSDVSRTKITLREYEVRNEVPRVTKNQITVP